MGMKMYQSVWQNSKAKGASLVVLLALAHHADDNGLCWPSIDRLAEMANVDRRSISRALQQLEELKEIERQVNRGRGNVNQYRISFENMTSLVENMTKVSPISNGKHDESVILNDVKHDESVMRKHDESVIQNQQQESSSLGDDDDDSKSVRELSKALQHHGVALNQAIIDRYMDVVSDYGIVAVLAGIESAGLNGKQQYFNYVKKCIASAATGSTPNGQQPIPAPRIYEAWELD